MAKSTMLNLYEDQFYGMDRRLDTDKLADGFSPLAVNVDLSKLGTVSKRQGSTLLGNAGVKGNFVQNIVQYTNSLAQKEIHMIRNGVLYKYNTVNNIWTVLNSTLNSTEQFASVNYKNRVYHTNINQNLFWNTGGGTLNTVDGNISGRCLAVGQRTLFIGNVRFNSTDYPDRVYFTEFDADTGETDTFWNTVDETGLADSTRWFRVEGGVVRAIVSFRGLVYVFSDTQCKTIDVTQIETNPFSAVQDVFSIGCAGSKAITVIDNIMYWIDREGKIWAWAGNSTRPEELSYQVDDGNLGDSVVGAIDKSASNLATIAVFGNSKRVYFSVGSIVLDRQVLPNACIKLCTSQNGLRANFSIDTYPDRILTACNVEYNSQSFIAVGNSSNVLLLNSGLNDVNIENLDVAVESYYRTKAYNFQSPFMSKNLKTLYLKLKPQLIENSYLDVAIATDRALDYVDVSAPNLADARFGSINMCDINAQKIRHITRKINIPLELQGFNFSFEFRNKEKDQTFELSAFGLDIIDVQDSNISINK